MKSRQSFLFALIWLISGGSVWAQTNVLFGPTESQYQVGICLIKYGKQGTVLQLMWQEGQAKIALPGAAPGDPATFIPVTKEKFDKIYEQVTGSLFAAFRTTLTTVPNPQTEECVNLMLLSPKQQMSFTFNKADLDRDNLGLAAIIDQFNALVPANNQVTWAAPKTDTPAPAPVTPPSTPTTDPTPATPSN